MCTGFVFKGKDIFYGYNLDIDPNVWNYDIEKKENIFTVKIKVGSTTYYTHGINNKSSFGFLPYMNGENIKKETKGKKYRIDLLIDRFLRKKISYKDVTNIIKEYDIVNIKNSSLHGLIGENKNVYLIEPGYGKRKIKENKFVIANFPILTKLENYENPFYGKKRYDEANKILSKSKEHFNYKDGLKLLEKVKQDGTWKTRLSFVYSKNDSMVYYCLDGDFKNIKKWKLEVEK